jgi:aryl-alcohol dehydrogenase-like predicted oxidoreductase
VIGGAHGKTIAQTALAWMLSKPYVTAPIVGASAPAQLDEALGAVGYRLSAEEIEQLDAITAWNK